MPGLAGRLDDVERGVAGVEEVHADPGRADVGGGAVTERDAARHEVGRLVVDGTLAGGAQHERAQLHRRAGRAQLLLRLDAHALQGAVGRAVQEPDRPGHHAREHPLRQLGDGGHALGQGEGQVLRDELADQHRDDGAEEEREPVRDGALRPAGDAEVLQRSAREPPDGRLGDEPDRQVGDRDAQLRPAELGRQAAQRLEGAGRARVAALGVALDRRAVDRHERELGRHEDAAREHEEERESQEEELGHHGVPDESGSVTMQGTVPFDVGDLVPERHPPTGDIQERRPCRPTSTSAPSAATRSRCTSRSPTMR